MQRTLLFGGQGSTHLHTPRAQHLATQDSTSPTGSLLLRTLHSAFLSELSHLPPALLKTLHLRPDDFQAAHTLLQPAPQYSTNAVIQGVLLTLYQLLRYAAWVDATPGAGYGEAREAAGFCSGVLAAAVVAGSAGVGGFLGNAVEAVRCAVWVGVRVEEWRWKVEVEGGEAVEVGEWGVVLFGAAKEVVRGWVSEFNEKEEAVRKLYVTAVTSPTTCTVSGPPSALSRFTSTLPSNIHTRSTHIHTLYHGGPEHLPLKQTVLSDLHRRSITLPAPLLPLRSTITGALLPPDVQILEAVLDMVLVECVNWDITAPAIIAAAAQDGGQIVNFGPGGGALGRTQDGLVQEVGHHVHIEEEGKPGLAPKPRFGEEDAIAIVGMGVDLPGAPDAEALWRILEEGINTVSEIPSTRFDISTYYTPPGTATSKRARKMGTKYGNFLADPSAFDAPFFALSPREATSLDPQQRVLLQTAYAALEHAGYVADATDSFARESLGCYVGIATGDYVDNLREEQDVYYATGNLRAFVSGRVSYALGLSGPSVVVDTACSSSLVAVWLACRALMNGDCKAAVAGGVNVISSPDMYLGLDRAHFLSPTGQCKAFDASADGYCRSEGSAMFVLKRLSTALSENDQILGVIRGVHVNQSGTAHSITHPHAATQQTLFRRLLTDTGVDPLDVSVIEAHGTGTQAGDPAELESLRGVFASGRGQEAPLWITSVKANIGHCEAASGAAGLAKLLLMLRRGVVPAQISLKVLNPKIRPLGVDGVRITQRNTEWVVPEGKRRLALLNNFGAAGSNGALLLEEAPEKTAAEKKKKTTDRAAYVFTMTAKSAAALERLRTRYIDFLTAHSSTLSLADICYTATARRTPFAHRVAITATSLDGLIADLRTAPPTQVHGAPRSKTVFVFSGQGSQYLGMGRSLLHTSPLFREIVDGAHAVLVARGFVGVMAVLDAEDGAELQLTDAQKVEAWQCSIFVLEYALAKLWISFGVQPDAVCGHSLGEYAALTIAGVLSLPDALTLVAHRARLMSTLCAASSSAMLAVAAPASTITALISTSSSFTTLEIACRNSPTDCVVAGPHAQIDALRSHLKANAIAKCLKLDVPYGYHSSAMDPILAPLTALARGIATAPPRIVAASNVTGAVLAAGDVDAGYFASHARGTVRFEEAVQAIAGRAEFEGSEVRWIEVGPNSVCLPMLRAVRGEGVVALPSMQKKREPWTTLSAALGGLWVSGAQVRWRDVFEGSAAACVDAPSYPFEQKQFWVPYKEPVLSIKGVKEEKEKNEEEEKKETGYLLLGSCVQPSAPGIDAVFETPIADLAELISGHLVGGAALCPASVYHELALAAAAFSADSDSANLHTLSDINYSHPLVYSPSSTAFTVRTTLHTAPGTSRTTFQITSYPTSSTSPAAPQVHCTGTIRLTPADTLAAKFRRRAAKLRRSRDAILSAADAETMHTRMLYEVVFPRVVSYAPSYQSVQRITIDRSGYEAFAIVKLPPSPAGNGKAKYTADPVFTDTLLHAAGFLANSAVSAADACICTATGKARVLYDRVDYSQTFGVVCAVNWEEELGAFVGEAWALDKDGAVVAAVEGMRFRKVGLEGFRRRLKTVGGKTTVRKQVLPIITTSTTSTTTIHKKEQITLPQAQVNIKALLATVLGVEVDEVTTDKDLAALGVDSLTTIELQQALKTQKITLLASDLLTCQTVGDLEALVPSTSVPVSGAANAFTPPLTPTTSTAQETPTTTGNANVSARIILETVLGVSADEISPDTHLDALGVDSLTTIELQQALSVAGIPLLAAQLSSCRTVGDLDGLIAEHSLPLPPPLSLPPPSAQMQPNNNNSQTKKTPPQQQHLSVIPLLSAVLGVPEADMAATTQLSAIGMDSLSWIEVCQSLKEGLGVVLDVRVVEGLRTVGEFQGLVGAAMRPGSIEDHSVRPDEAVGYKAQENSITTTTITTTAAPVTDTTATAIKDILQMHANPAPVQRALVPGAAPLFLVHDGSGTSTYYSRLAPLGRDAWAFWNPRFVEGGQWKGGVAEMAGVYARRIKEMMVKQSGGCIVGGWSYGGVVAFEIARLLRRDGVTVKGLLLIDSPPPLNHVPLPASIIASASASASGTPAPTSATKTRIQSLIKAQFEHNTANLVAYRPTPNALRHGPQQGETKVVLLRCADGVRGCGHEWLENRADVSVAVAGWETVLGGGKDVVRVLDVPGDHFGVFKGGNVNEVSRRVKEACELMDC